jgi:hypothetical protein
MIHHGLDELNVIFALCQAATEYDRLLAEAELKRPHQIVLEGEHAKNFVDKYGELVGLSPGTERVVLETGEKK